MELDIDVDELLLDPNRFLPVPTIAHSTPIVTLIERCLRWQMEGVPFVIKGVHLDGRESPFLRTEGWRARLPRFLGEYSRSLQTERFTNQPIIRRAVNWWGPGVRPLW